MKRVAVLASLAFGCGGGAQDVVGGTSTFQIPSIGGTYDATVSEVEADDPEACVDDLDALLSWLEGTMEVSGPPAELVFETEAGEQVLGSIDATFQVLWGGTVVREEGEFDLSGEGLAYIDGGRWVLELDLEVGLEGTSESADCALTALFQAGQILE